MPSTQLPRRQLGRTWGSDSTAQSFFSACGASAHPCHNDGSNTQENPRATFQLLDGLVQGADGLVLGADGLVLGADSQDVKVPDRSLVKPYCLITDLLSDTGQIITVEEEQTFVLQIRRHLILSL